MSDVASPAAPGHAPDDAPDDARAKERTVVLLGAQRFDATLGAVVKELDVDGPIALITAGWQDREADDAALKAHLGCESVNLRLYQRAEEVFAQDQELAHVHRTKQAKLRHKQDFYRIRLEHELDANHVIRQRKAPPEVLEEEEGASLAAIRSLDAYHLAQCARVHAELDAEVDPLSRPSVIAHRKALAEIMKRCRALCIAGGHVASLLNRLRLFGIADMLEDHVIFAWSAGAMTLTERVVLFHDSPPQGPGASEILDEGLGIVPGVVVLPHPETRLRLSDPDRVSILARRAAPATCLAFPEGAHVTVQGGRAMRPKDVLHLLPDGACVPFTEAELPNSAVARPTEQPS